MRKALITQDTFRILPSTLKAFCSIGTNEDERDVLLLSALGTISGCLPNKGRYRKQEVYSNLYVVVIAPPGAGKGVMRFAKKIAIGYNDYLKTIPGNEIRILLPGNSSAAAIAFTLERNNGLGLIFESEVDTLTTALKQDWGSFSDVLRKNLHHEPVSIARRGDPPFIDIPCPRFGMALSGTRSQLYPLVDSVQNGLFSRLAFLTLKPDINWQDVSPAGETMDITGIDEVIHRLVSALIYNEKYPFELTMSKPQWDLFNNHFRSLLETYATDNPDLDASIKRLGLMAFRICIILSSLRRFEEERQTPQQQCKQEDFDTALELADSLFENLVEVYGFLKSSEATADNSPLMRFLQKLPSEFTRAEAVEIGQPIAERTVDKYLKRLVLIKLLEKDAYGSYRKVTGQ